MLGDVGCACGIIAELRARQVERAQAPVKEGLAPWRQRIEPELADGSDPELIAYECHTSDDLMGRRGGDRGDRPDNDEQEANGGEAGCDLAMTPELAGDPSVDAVKDARKHDGEEEWHTQGPDDVEREPCGEREQQPEHPARGHRGPTDRLRRDDDVRADRLLPLE